MAGLEFTEEAAERLEALYLTSDVVAQRAATLERLELSPGESVIDIGSGPGFLSEAMADAVGPSGRVLGIDISPDLVQRSRSRNRRPWLEYRAGDAAALDDADATYDVAVCTQVAEYVPDVDRVISETARVLRPGGRATFIATDWDAVVWHSDEPARMRRVLGAWEAHCAHPHLPRSFRGRSSAHGLSLRSAGSFPILNLEWSDDAYSKGLSRLVRDFVVRRGDVPEDEAAAWYGELEALGEAGRYYFSSTRTLFHLRKD